MPRRFQDWLFFAYFAIQIPTTIFFDAMAVYPNWLFPSWAHWLRSHYLSDYRDPFMADTWSHPWFLSVCLVEHFIEVPFFFYAAEAYFHGITKRPKVLIFSLMYAIHTITAVLAVWAMALGGDFSQSADVYPRTLWERIYLCSAYFPFIATCTAMVYDSVHLLWKYISIAQNRVFD